jgi:hypothetical protein
MASVQGDPERTNTSGSEECTRNVWNEVPHPQRTTDKLASKPFVSYIIKLELWLLSNRRQRRGPPKHSVQDALQ